MSKVRNCRIQFNVGLTVLVGSTVCAIRIGKIQRYLTYAEWHRSKPVIISYTNIEYLTYVKWHRSKPDVNTAIFRIYSATCLYYGVG